MANRVGSVEVPLSMRVSWFYSLRDWFVRFQENKLAVVGLVISRFLFRIVPKGK